MAKYIKSYEEGIEQNTLEFFNEVFSFKMIPNSWGTESDKEDFGYQMHKKFPEISEEDLEETGIEDLSFEEDADVIFEILESLDILEREMWMKNKERGKSSYVEADF